MMAYSHPRHDDLMDALPKHWAGNLPDRPLAYEDFHQVRIARRVYVFTLGGKTIKRYRNASRHGSERRFRQWLPIYNITRRLLS
jgi:hypothetical protein